MTIQAHPPLPRDRVGLVSLFFGIAGGPGAWSCHLIANFALDSHFCFAGTSPQYPALGGLDWLRPALVLIDIAALGIALAAALVSYRNWQIARQELNITGHDSRFTGHAHALLETGEGRTRFMALWGIMTAAGFFVVILFDVAGLVMLPLCG